MNEKPVNPLTLSFLRSIEKAYGIYLKEIPVEGKEGFSVRKRKLGEPEIGQIVSDEEYFDGLELKLKILKLPGMNPIAKPEEWPKELPKNPTSGC